MIILTSIWLLRVKTTNGAYRRILRGPPQLPRSPPAHVQHSLKKWNVNAQRQHIQRPRPIPLHMPAHNFKAPIGPPVSTRYTTPLRKQHVWKSAQILKLSTEKPFLSSPTVAMPEYEYHIQTNSIPHPNTIQQNDEKGPIHTIPAPNLSLADKPNNVERVPVVHDTLTDNLLNRQIQQQQLLQQQQLQQQQFQHQLQQQQLQQQLQQSLRQQQNTVVEIQKSKQYEVTEASPLKLPLYFAPDPTTNVRNSDFGDQVHNQPHAEFLLAPSEQLLGNQLSPQELYKLLNSYPQQQLLDTYPLSISQQPQLQQHIQQQKGANYQVVTSNIQLPHQDHNPVVSKKLPVQPQFQLFNYNEQDHRNLVKNQISSRVGADYSVKPYEDEDPADALAQAQYIQQYFDTHEENIANNNVEQQESDAKVRESSFFSTLPNKEAAETLAQLQEAGELNSKSQMNVQVSKKIPVSIYVPDNYEENNEENDHVDKEESDNKSDYEDLSLEESVEVNNNYGRGSSYGSRIRNKSN